MLLHIFFSHDSIKPGDESSQAYQDGIKILRQFVDGTDIIYAYTLKPLDSQNLQFVLDADKEAPAAIGKSLVRSDEINKALEGSVIAEKNSTSDEWGEYYSAYAPIHNSAGNIVGIVGVD